MFIACINVFMSQVRVSPVPFGSFDPDEFVLLTPYGEEGWVSRNFAGTLLLIRTISATVAMVAALSSIIIGVAYTATLTTWLLVPSDVIAWNQKFKLMVPVYFLVIATWAVVLSMECHVFLAYPYLIGGVCFVIFTLSWLALNVYIFMVYSKYFEGALDKKAASVWIEIQSHVDEATSPMGSALDVPDEHGQRL